MKRKQMTIAITAAALMAAPLATWAQQVELPATVAERFDGRVVVETAEGRLLLEIGQGAPALLVPGAPVIVTGERDGRTIRAAQVRADPQPSVSAIPVQAQASVLPSIFADLGLTDIRDRVDDDGEREIRALLPGGARFEAEYARSGQLEEVKSDPRAALPEVLLERILPQPVRATLAQNGLDRVHEIEFEDGGRVEVKGRIGPDRAEMEIAPDGRLLELERRAARAENGRPFGLSEGEVASLARAAGYDQISRVHIRGRHADLWAENPDGEPVRVRINGAGEIVREERR